MIWWLLLSLGWAQESSDLNREKSEDAVPEWSCRVDSAPSDSKGFTVGERFTLLCEGERADFSKGDLFFQLPESLLYALRVLDVEEATSNKVVLTVTSYMAGSLDLKDLYFAEDGVEKFKVKPFALAIQSVIQNPEQKPFPPRTALRLGYPLWVKIAGGSLVFLFLLALFYRWYRKEQKQRTINNLRKHSSALGAYNQFNKDLRGVGRNYIFSSHKPWDQNQVKEYLEKLDTLFRMFILREFLVPANQWSSSAVVKEIKKYDKSRFPRYGSHLAKLLKELDRARKVEDQVSMEDCKQLTLLSRKVSQKIWLVRKETT